MPFSVISQRLTDPGDYYTGGSLNPARSLGPDVINRSFPGYHWIYWVGPLLGSLLASGFYGFLSLFDWQSVNPGQDFNEYEAKMGCCSPDPASGRPSRAYSEATTLNREQSPHGTRANGANTVAPNIAHGPEQV